MGTWEEGGGGGAVEWWIARDTLQSWGMSLRREKNWLKCNLICRNLTAVILEFFYASPIQPFSPPWRIICHSLAFRVFSSCITRPPVFNHRKCASRVTSAFSLATHFSFNTHNPYYRESNRVEFNVAWTIHEISVIIFSIIILLKKADYLQTHINIKNMFLIIKYWN